MDKESVSENNKEHSHQFRLFGTDELGNTFNVELQMRRVTSGDSAGDSQNRRSESPVIDPPDFELSDIFDEEQGQNPQPVGKWRPGLNVTPTFEFQRGGHDHHISGYTRCVRCGDLFDLERVMPCECGRCQSE